MSRSSAQPTLARLALLPGLLGAIALVAGLALIGGDWYVVIRFAAAILALIVCVFAVQSKGYWWLVGLVPLAVALNPVWPLPLGDLWLRLVQLAGAVVFIAAGIAVKVPVDDGRGRPAGRYDGRKPPAASTRRRASGHATKR